MTKRRTTQELKELRERITTLERSGLKASAEALRKQLPRERVKPTTPEKSWKHQNYSAGKR